MQNSRAGGLLALVQQMGIIACRGRRVALLVVLCIVLATAGAQPGPYSIDMASQRACNSYSSIPACMQDPSSGAAYGKDGPRGQQVIAAGSTLHPASHSRSTARA